MDSEFRTKLPRSDPDKRKPLIQFIVALALIIPLASIEYMIVSEMVRTGSLRGLFQAIIYGLLLAILIPALCFAIWRQLNRPPLEERLRQADLTLERQPNEQVFIVPTPPAVPPNVVVHAALPITLLIIAIYGACVDRLDLFFIMLTAATIIGGTLLFVFRREKSNRRPILTVDKSRRIIRFEHFQFVSAFLPEKPRTLEEVSFDHVLGTDFHAANEGSASLLVRTVKGSVTIPDSIDHFGQLRTVLGSLVEINKSDAANYQESLNAEPEIKTAWYGWLILAGAFGAIALLIWKSMYGD